MSNELRRGSIRFVPLGGLGEIGMNCFALEHAEGILVVDCGTAFPHDDVGVDVIHPDFEWLVRRKQRVSGVFVTHGHEDHIGGLPYLLDDVAVPVWGPPHALGLVRRRLDEHGYRPDEVTLNIAHAASSYDVGPFRVSPLRVAHSIVEASALAIEVDGIRFFHTGDFNLDPDPPDGEPTDREGILRFAEKGVHLMTSDSTNIDVARRSGSEREVGEALEQLIAKAPQRVLIALFASNIQRLILLSEIAERTGRKLCLLGRSLQNQVEVARQIRRLRVKDSLFVAPQRVSSMPPEEVLILAGGSQGETYSAMRRIASRTHPEVSIEPGDVVVHSARVIPGNDRPVLSMFCDLLRQGAVLHTRFSDPAIHTSGHADRSEQSQMIQWVQPQHFLPVHGTLHHMNRHADLARELGVESTLVVENGTPVVVSKDGDFYKEFPTQHGHVHVAFGGSVLDPDTRQLRADLGRAGTLSVSIVIDRGGESIAPPSLVSLGIPGVDGDGQALRRLAHAAAETLERRQDPQQLEDAVRHTLRRVLRQMTGTRPNVVVHLVQIRDEQR